MRTAATIFSIGFLFWNALAQSSEKNSGSWLGYEINLETLQNKVNTYHMMDSSGSKVGSMVFSWFQEGDVLVSRDTSEFDDGSIYETAQMAIDLNTMELISDEIQMVMGNVSLNLELNAKDTDVVGTYRATRDTSVLVDTVVNATLRYDIFRSEIYMLLSAAELNQDSVAFDMFFPNQLFTIPASLTYEGVETISIQGKPYDTDVVWLQTDQNVMNNRIWISRTQPRNIVKFYVPNGQLSIELVDSRPWK